MLKLIWCNDDCEAIADGHVEQFVKNVIEDYSHYGGADKKVNISQEIVFSCFRVAIKKKKIDHHDIIFIYVQEIPNHMAVVRELRFDKDGNMEDYPMILNVATNFLEELL